ncbi:hypothetical protein T06_13639 [Trichinella sp. T6]|nr:hypothetical protein T06_13639 [Trichinella sp. T6]
MCVQSDLCSPLGARTGDLDGRCNASSPAFHSLAGRPATIQTDNFRSFQSVASEQHRPGLSGTALDLNCCHQARFQAAGAGASTHQ